MRCTNYMTARELIFTWLKRLTSGNLNITKPLRMVTSIHSIHTRLIYTRNLRAGKPGIFQTEKNLRYTENDLHDFFAYVSDDQAHATKKLRNKYPSETLVGVGANANAGTMHSWTSYPYYHQTFFAPSIEFGLRLYSQRIFLSADHWRNASVKYF